MESKIIICVLNEAGEMIEGLLRWHDYIGGSCGGSAAEWAGSFEPEVKKSIIQTIQEKKVPNSGQLVFFSRLVGEETGAKRYLVTLARVCDLNGWVLAVHEAVATDLEEKLLFHNVISENMSEGVSFIQARIGKIVYSNTRFEKMFGYGPGEMKGLDVSKLNAPSELSPEETAKMIVGALEKDGEWTGEVENVRKDGTHFWSDYRVTRFMHHKYGEVWLGVGSDITERKRAEKELKLSASIIENATEGVVITDIRGVITFINPSITKMTGYLPSEIIGKSPRIWKSGVHESAFYEEMWHSLLAKGEWEGELWNRKKNGELFPVKLSIIGIKNESSRYSNYAGVMSDMTEIKSSQKEIEHRAYHDPLTGLPNRALFLDRLEQRSRRSHRDHSCFAILFVDIDDFKKINDSLGHLIGDKLLWEISQRLLITARESDTVARLGGDEFTILMEDFDEEGDAGLTAGRIVKALARPFSIDSNEFSISASIGIAIGSEKDKTDDILRNADLAMYQAKELGKNNYYYFNESLNLNAVKRLEIENDIRKAIQLGEVEAYFQPKVDTHSGKLVGMEALARLVKKTGEVIYPADFISVAESSGLVIEIGEIIIEQAIFLIRHWSHVGLKPVPISVNISPRQFQQSNLVEMIRKNLDRYHIDHSLLGLELTESLIMSNPAEAADTMRRLRDIGISISMDDFGTGYSSLSYLQKFPVDSLKIDQSFIHELNKKSGRKALASSIIDIGKNLNLMVVAEGVESCEQFKFLAEENCDQVQGYFISPPMNGADTDSWLKANERIRSVIDACVKDSHGLPK